MENDERKIDLLLVDDEADFRQAAARALGRQGFDVRLAQSGEQALEMLASHRPEVMILDLRMEGMDGIDTLIELRNRDPDLPVIILTGHGRYTDALAGIRLDVVDFVQKPVDMHTLGVRIRALLKRDAHRPMREKTVRELMTDPERFARLYMDQPIRDLMGTLAESITTPAGDDPIGRPRRVVRVYDRQDRFLGLIRIEDVLREVVPGYLRDSLYASYFTGMFVAQIKTVGSRPVEDFIRQSVWVAPDAPLMEVIHVLVSANRHDVPVLEAGKLVGVIRGIEIFREIAIGMGIDIMAGSGATTGPHEQDDTGD